MVAWIVKKKDSTQKVTYEIDVRPREDIFSLHQLSGMTLVKEVVDPVGIDPNLSGGHPLLRQLGRDLKNVLKNW